MPHRRFGVSSLLVEVIFSICLLCVDASPSDDGTLSSLRQLHGSPPYLKVSNATGQVIGILDILAPDLPQPKQRDLRTNKLMKKLGTDFDPQYMSVVEPEQKNAPTTTSVQDSLQRQATTLDFTYTNDDGDVVNMDRQTTELLQRWLVQKASCSVKHDWVDVGLLFWPRWIKHGQCVQQRCSWPHGMSCEPGPRATHIQLLRWYCKTKKKSRHPLPIQPSNRFTREAAKKAKSKRCKWIKVPYPIVAECVCQCEGRNRPN